VTVAYSRVSENRKFFTFIVIMNLVGLICAGVDVWHYPRRYTSPLVLGNLFAAVLVRNELFGRFLYLVVNTLFAKVSNLNCLKIRLALLTQRSVAASLVPPCMHVGPSTPWWYSLRLCCFRLRVAHLQALAHRYAASACSRHCAWYHYHSRNHDFHRQCHPLGSQQSPQVSV
jgi:hypothetical protein